MIDDKKLVKDGL